MELRSCNKLKEIQLTLKLNKQKRSTSEIAMKLQNSNTLKEIQLTFKNKQTKEISQWNCRAANRT